MVVTGSGLIAAGAELVAAGICWCRKAVAGSRRRTLEQEGGRCCRNVDAGAGIVAAGAELAAAGAGRWSLLQEGGRRCKKVVAGAGLVVAVAGKCSPVQECSS